MHATLALLALLIEAAVGFPEALVTAIGHPVMWIGNLIQRAEKELNDPNLPDASRRRNGVLALAIVLAVTLAIAVAITEIANVLPGLLATLVLAVAASTALAQRSLDQHVSAVATALETGGIEAGRRAVSMIVGRDPNALDEAGVARAAIESLAENFSDGIVAPALWLTAGGLPGAALYKAINTADSMIGHKSERYLMFGWAAARLDDLVNLPASRLAAVWLTAAAAIHPAASASAAVRVVRADAVRHRSPNAGWPEAAMAGALGLKLNGPRVYDGKRVEDAYMGDGRADLTAADIRRALGLYRLACAIEIAAIGLLALVL